MDFASIESKLVEFLKREVGAAGFERVVFGLSGGVDSAVVAALCKKAFGHNILAVMIPSDTTSPTHMGDALGLCEKFDIEAEHVSIKNMLLAYPLQLSDKMRKGNIAARLRMAVLYDISRRDNALVVGTSNKSEIILGYGTLFGDTACALNPIGELYKTQVWGLAQHLGVPESIVQKAPSADLWEGQSDEGEIGHRYLDMDAAMYLLFDLQKTKEEVVAAGHDAKMLDTILDRYGKNLFKTRLPKIASIA